MPRQFGYFKEVISGLRAGKHAFISLLGLTM